MSTINMVNHKQDWHPADIKAALEKKGWSLRRLSMAHGYAPNTLRNAIRAPWPKAEEIIAEAIGVMPWEIWPSRYHNGKPNRPMGPPRRKFRCRG